MQPFDDGVIEVVAGLTPTQAIGIPLALLGAVFMSIGALLQHRGVAKVEARSGTNAAQGLSVAHVLRLLGRPSWLVGTLLLLLAIALQLASLVFAPLVIVQPLGVVSLLLTTVITARIVRMPLSPIKWTAVAMCVLGVGAFVTVAAFFAVEHPVRTSQIVTVLVILAVVVVAFGVAFALLRRRFKALFYIVGAGIIYGFVATLAKIVISRIQQGDVEGLTIVCIVGIVIGTAAGAYFVQTAYASGPPDMVVAGLTVVDPIVAVVIGVAVLREVDGAPWYAYVLFAVFGAVAIAGVVLLERGQTEAEIDAARRHAIGVAADAGGSVAGQASPNTGDSPTDAAEHGR